MRSWILRVSRGVIYWISALVLLFLTGVSLVSTWYFSAQSGEDEHPLFKWDLIPLNLIWLIAIIALLYLLNKKKIWQRIPERVLVIAAVLVTVVLSLVWVKVSHAYPEADQRGVSLVAIQAAQGEYTFFAPAKYMQFYPNQLGIVAILEVLYRISGWENWMLLMYLNAAANGVIVYCLYRITGRLFRDDGISRLVLFASVGCVQLIFYSTFVYGITIGLALALAAVDLVLLYLEKEKLIYAFLGAILIGASVLTKNNYSIMLLALVLLLLYKALEKKKLKHLLSAVLLVLLTMVMSRGLTTVYEVRSGYTITSGMPKTLWIAMGMQEGDRAEGWYNRFNFDTFTDVEADIEEGDRLGREAIRERLEVFASDPLYALTFYYRKTVTQWNEPTYEAIWVNRWHDGDFLTVVQSIYDGTLGNVLAEYMDLYQLLVFAGFLACLLIRRRQLSPEQLLLPLILLGGFAFHTLWEAKSQYIYPYFVCMLPCAAAGLMDLSNRLTTRKRQERKQEA